MIPIFPRVALAPGASKTRIDRMSQLKSMLLAAALLMAALFAPGAAGAQTCTFTTGPTVINFGAYDPGLGTPDDSTGTFRFNCNPNARPRVSLSTGAGTFAQRQMVMGADRLNYNLYRDAARTQIWGDGTAPSVFLNRARRNTTYTIYGRAPAGQWVAAGNYLDTITITLLY
jgi:spore coat protein U-like protein